MTGKRIFPFLSIKISLPWLLFLLGLTVYLIVRLIGLAQYPIYFFSDEAIQTVLAADLVRDGIRGPGGEFLPTYFKNGTFYNLSLSVYIQVLPFLIFGKSVYITRLVSVIISLIAAISVGLILKQIFNIAYWWLGPLSLSIVPAWFLHSRTAFETVIFASCYAGFLYTYLLYRRNNPAYLAPAICMAAFSFYSYSPGQVVILVTGILLFLTDIGYHWRQRKWILAGFIIAIILAIPYIRFINNQAGAPFDQLRDLNSYWLQPTPFVAKIYQYLENYLYGLNPAYWFIPNEHDLQRHTMKGYGHISFITMPFILVGLIHAIKNIREPEYRTIIISLLAAPVGSALVGIGITRVLVFVVPYVILFTIGLSKSILWVFSPIKLNFLFSRFTNSFSKQIDRITTVVIPVIVFGLFVLGNLYMLYDVLRNGPTWYDNYGLYGMQYGAKQLFEGIIPKYLYEDPENEIFVSSLWANGADVLPRFFLNNEQQKQLRMGSIDTFLSKKENLDQIRIFIITPEEFDQVIASNKLKIIEIEAILPYPNGKAGFYVLRMDYADGINEIFARERVAQQLPKVENIVLDGQNVKVTYSQIDSGQISDIFDGNRHTLIRGLIANPFFITLEFENPITVKGISADFGSMDFDLTIDLNQQGTNGPISYSHHYRNMPDDPHIELLFDRVYFSITKLTMTILSLNRTPEEKIHIREVKLIQ